MGSFEDFETELTQALTRLYDADYRPTVTLRQVMALEASQGAGPFQSAVVQAIEELKPAPGIPPATVLGRIYDVLRHRFVLRLTQEETAERLTMGVRSLRRAQRESVHRLARHLWDRASRSQTATETTASGEFLATESRAQSLEWLSQVREELAALRESVPVAAADVSESVNGAVQLARVLTARQAMTLEIGTIQPQLQAVIHPSALKQVLLAGIRLLAGDMLRGRVTLDAQRQQGQCLISMTASPATNVESTELSLMQEILVAHAGSIRLHQHSDGTSLVIRIPSVPVREERVTVLVVDDNKDLVRSFQLYAAGTRYDVVPAGSEQRLIEAIERVSPDIIMLDVMLPHTDGWELLVHLRAHPATRSTPIIVCSVVKEEDLALALGATLYLPKPMLRRQFIAALNQALTLTGPVASESRVSSEATD